ncbi:MAG: hypothetical protein R2861_13555 [Desulfobacterales bacterium]
MFDENNVPLYRWGYFDVTENTETVIKHQELEKQLRQAQKLEALGALAGALPTISIISYLPFMGIPSSPFWSCRRIAPFAPISRICMPLPTGLGNW